MELLQTVLGFLLALFVLVSVHEFGHFYVARLCGVKVLRFCIGMGKPFCSYRDKHGTEFGLAPFPLGGYVKMLDEREGNVSADERHLAYSSKTPWQRIAILLAGPAANFLLAIGVFWILLFVGGTAGLAPTIGAVTPGSVAANAGVKSGHEIVAIDGVATSTRQAVVEQLFLRLGESGALALSVVEPKSDVVDELTLSLENWLQGAKDPDPVAGLGLDFYLPPIQFGEVVVGSPAEQAGLQAGDKLLSVDGQTYSRLEPWIDLVKSHAGKPLRFVVDRDGRPIDLIITPTEKTVDGGAVVGQIGVGVGYGAFDQDLVRRQEFGFFEAFGRGVEKTFSTTQFVLMSLQKLILGEISTKNLSGPIGIAKVAGDQARAGLVYFVEFLAILSIYLGVLNLLPIPILDGGHIVYCLIEAIKGSPVSERIQSMGLSMGLALLGGVMIVAFYNDLLRF